jgi:hypothetical protein
MIDPPPNRIVVKLPLRGRAVFPCSAVARYSGRGSMDEAASFILHRAEPHADIANWIGGAP